MTDYIYIFHDKKTSLKKMLNRSGPKTDSIGAPKTISNDSQFEKLVFNICFVFSK